MVGESEMDALAVKRHPGPGSCLSEKQKEELINPLLKGPRTYGYRKRSVDAALSRPDDREPPGLALSSGA